MKLFPNIGVKGLTALGVLAAFAVWLLVREGPVISTPDDVPAGKPVGREFITQVDLSVVSQQYEDETSSVYIRNYANPAQFSNLRKIDIEIDFSVARESRTFLKLHDAETIGQASLEDNRNYQYLSMGLLDINYQNTGQKPVLDSNGGSIDKLYDRVALQDSPAANGGYSHIDISIFDPASAKHAKHLSFDVQYLDEQGRMNWEKGAAAYMREAPLTGFMFIASGPISGTATIIGYRKQGQ